MSRRLLALLCCALLAGCVRVNVHGDPGQAMTPDHTLRVATYNASLYSDEAGGLLRRLESGDANARKVAAVLQRVRPDVVLVNEFDHDPTGRAADAFQRDYLEVPQAGGGAALRYPYRYFAPVNTGVPSGLDLDRSGHVAASGPVEGEDAAGARMDVDRLLATLSPKQARAIRDTHVEGKSIAEAASGAGIGESDVKISVHRGLKALAARIKGQG